MRKVTPVARDAAADPQEQKKPRSGSDLKGADVHNADYSLNKKGQSQCPSSREVPSPDKPRKFINLLPPHEVPSRWTASETCIWLVFLCSCLVGYLWFSDGKTSALLTLSAAFYTLSVVFLVFNARVCSIAAQAFCGTHAASHATETQSATSASESRRFFSILPLLCGGYTRPASAGIFAIALLARVACNLRRPAYLPNDRTGDWLYQTLEIFSALLLLLLVGVVSANSRFCRDFSKRTNSSISRSEEKDETEEKRGETSVISGCRCVLVTALICGLVLKHDMNESFFEDFAWSFALYAETLAFIPFVRHQPFVFSQQKAGACAKKEQASPLTAEGQQLVAYRYRRNPVLARRLWRQFLFSLVVSRAIQMVFWAVTFEEFSPEVDTDSISELPTEQGGDLPDEYIQHDKRGMADFSLANLNIRGWCSLAATVAQLCCSLYLMKVYCSTQSHLEQEYFVHQKNASEGEDETDYTRCALEEKTASRQTEAVEEKAKVRGVLRKRFVPAPQ
ncbi:conserved hypothetical protein [Neospora caninum Liverpool]|uniref:Transmembrane protein n=1 Tax=Neospora caninum (strain Liverpool) TaxID=572307 RepID=F0VHG0_NEOCL|nr:conserved hypothetical protein [Neospora caninum Liverpool]CBZ53154.1 conserved hypothetical protein [Neospora caninum Liverpool]CEL67144.1 TPA: hypothetical protein BN1204_029410 [Neospora caninum Liverpool]|eukprot:XP_003883186.1 conserved hypothetical protein [Neospora caninum Liverpool]